MVEKETIEFDPSVFEDDDAVTDAAAYTAARTIELGIRPDGAKFYLEPLGVGALRGIVVRKGSTKIPTPESLQGAYTDVQTAQRVVQNFIGNIGKKKPATTRK